MNHTVTTQHPNLPPLSLSFTPFTPLIQVRLRLRRFAKSNAVSETYEHNNANTIHSRYNSSTGVRAKRRSLASAHSRRSVTSAMNRVAPEEDNMTPVENENSSEASSSERPRSNCFYFVFF